MPVNLQYCYAHLLREVEKLEKEFPEIVEINHFVSEFSVLLAKAMKLRGCDITNTQYYAAASEIRSQMALILRGDWKHSGIQRMQLIFHTKKHRLCHRVKDRSIHADNNRAERE